MTTEDEADEFRYEECSTCGCECEGCSEQVRDKDCEDPDGCPYCLCGSDAGPATP